MDKQLPEFKIIGIQVRTTNQDGQANLDIGSLWQRFMAESIFEKIPGKLADDLYCLYTDYESNHLGSYTTLVGCRVSSMDFIPRNLNGMTIPASRYRVFISSGKIPEAIANTWTAIWASGLARTYVADFDLYSERSKDPQNVEVETYVSVP